MDEISPEPKDGGSMRLNNDGLKARLITRREPERGDGGARVRPVQPCGDVGVDSFGECLFGLWGFTIVRMGLPKVDLPGMLLSLRLELCRVLARILVTSNPKARFVLRAGAAAEDETVGFGTALRARDSPDLTRLWPNDTGINVLLFSSLWVRFVDVENVELFLLLLFAVKRDGFIGFFGDKWCRRGGEASTEDDMATDVQLLEFLPFRSREGASAKRLVTSFLAWLKPSRGRKGLRCWCWNVDEDFRTRSLSSQLSRRKEDRGNEGEERK